MESAGLRPSERDEWVAVASNAHRATFSRRSNGPRRRAITGRRILMWNETSRSRSDGSPGRWTTSSETARRRGGDLVHEGSGGTLGTIFGELPVTSRAIVVVRAQRPIPLQADGDSADLVFERRGADRGFPPAHRNRRPAARGGAASYYHRDITAEESPHGARARGRVTRSRVRVAAATSVPVDYHPFDVRRAGHRLPLSWTFRSTTSSRFHPEPPSTAPP